ncbi:spore coat U domain-containing protein [Herbaspirillum sp. alder98]|uniref:Csu type fimbrial protein n=1 Tax=Herbaspirillum sp. alder98 TaxID=2913096 RepID=UPI001CD8DEA9|nr:spore coat U domain-containing protein [Herbaspirillum sp. alder98]MCA1324008.1 spore coat U domain-containing protein [Herbaspirillum sp. alder98]
MKKIHVFVLAAGIALSSQTTSFAASTTGNLTVSAVVTAQCVIQSAAIPFGTYSSGAVQQNAQIGVNCSNGTSYTISLDAGSGTGATTATRKLANTAGGSSLNYGLYQDAARTKTWGNASGSDTIAGVGSGTTQNIPVYGYIPGGQTSTAGSYSDVVAITLAY